MRPQLPQELTLPAIVGALKDIHLVLDGLTTGNVDMSGRRVINAGFAVGPRDYTTYYQVKELLGNLESQLTGLQKKVEPTLLNLGDSLVTVGPFSGRGSPVGTSRIYVASDINYISYVNTGGVWRYLSGIEAAAFASLRSGLTTNDTGYLFQVTDYSHLLQWNGTGWQWGPGDLGSGYSMLFEAAPANYGANAWQVYDGSTVARLNSDGTTTNVTPDNLGTAAYLKASTSAASVASASGTTDNTVATNNTTSVGLNKSTVAVQSGSGTTVLADADTSPDPHGHTQSAHNHGPGSLELRNKQLRLYYRR